MPKKRKQHTYQIWPCETATTESLERARIARSFRAGGEYEWIGKLAERAAVAGQPFVRARRALARALVKIELRSRPPRYEYNPEVAKLMQQLDLVSGTGRKRTDTGWWDLGAAAAFERDLFAPPVGNDGKPLPGKRAPYHTEKRSQGWVGRSCRIIDADELRIAIKKRRHRTEEQERVLDLFRIYLATRRPPCKELADALGVGERTIKRYRKDGIQMLEELKQELLEGLRVENEKQTSELLKAIGINPVAWAEQILAEERERQP